MGASLQVALDEPALQVARLFLSWKDQTSVGSCLLLSKFASLEASCSLQRRVFESEAVVSQGAALGIPSLQTANATKDPNNGQRLMLGHGVQCGGTRFSHADIWAHRGLCVGTGGSCSHSLSRQGC